MTDSSSDAVEAAVDNALDVAWESSPETKDQGVVSLDAMVNTALGEQEAAPASEEPDSKESASDTSEGDEISDEEKRHFSERAQRRFRELVEQRRSVEGERGSPSGGGLHHETARRQLAGVAARRRRRPVPHHLQAARPIPCPPAPLHAERRVAGKRRHVRGRMPLLRKGFQHARLDRQHDRDQPRAPGVPVSGCRCLHFQCRVFFRGGGGAGPRDGANPVPQNKRF